MFVNTVSMAAPVLNLSGSDRIQTLADQTEVKKKKFIKGESKIKGNQSSQKPNRENSNHKGSRKSRKGPIGSTNKTKRARLKTRSKTNKGPVRPGKAR